MRSTAWLAALLIAGSAAPLLAQDVQMSGQIRPRYEFRDPAGGGKDEFSSMRVRMGLRAMLESNVTVFAQFQDVRLFGEETSTLADFSADNLDLHQGWLSYRGEKLDWLTTTVGRMETNLGGQRLVGAVGWTQQGRSFDGLRFDMAPEWGNIAVMAYKLGDETAATVAFDSEFYGTYAVLDDVGPGSLDLYWLYDRVEGAVETGQHTTGARYAFPGTINGRLEASFQSGTRAGMDVSAYMMGGRLGTTFADGDATATLWYDRLSGDDPGTSEVEVFHTLFATNHKFYGFADLFLNIPVHTAGAGLADAAVKLAWSPSASLRLAADLHRFSAVEAGAISDMHFADEIDLTVSHRYTPNLVMTAGMSRVLQGERLGAIGRLGEDMTWFYVMLDAIF